MKLLKYLLGLVGAGLLLFFAIGFFIPSFDYQTTIVVNSPVEQSFEVFMDESQAHLWLKGLKEFTLISGKANQVGSKYKVVIENEGEEFEMIEEIITYQENEQFAFQVVNDVMMVETDVVFKDLNGDTEITSKTIITGKNLFWKSIFPLQKGNYEKENQFQYERLKAVIEAQ